MQCTICNQTFETGRKDAKFCSPACKQKAFRNVTRNVTRVTDNVTDSVTDKREEDHDPYGWFNDEYIVRYLAAMYRIDIEEARKLI